LLHKRSLFTTMLFTTWCSAL